MPVKTHLERIRKEHDEERMDLVRDLNVSYQVIQKWEKGILHQLDTNILHKIMERYNVRYEDLIYEIEKS